MTLFSYSLSVDENGNKTESTLGLDDNQYSFAASLAKGPLEAGVSMKGDVSGLTENEFSVSVLIMNLKRNNLNKTTSSGLKFLGGSTNAGPLFFNIELGTNDSGFKPYKDPTKVERNATIYVIPTRYLKK